MYILYFALIGSVLVFINLNHPIRLGLVLIFHTLLIRAITGLAGGNFWFSYVLFLVFLGGVLVLFIYITRLASNEQFTVNWAVLGGIPAVGVFAVVGLGVLACPTLDSARVTVEWAPQALGSLGLGELVIKAYRVESFKITAMLVFYLLYALLVCANIVNSYAGALRNFN